MFQKGQKPNLWMEIHASVHLDISDPYILYIHTENTDKSYKVDNTVSYCK